MEMIEPIYWPIAAMMAVTMAIIVIIIVPQVSVDANKAVRVEGAETQALSKLYTAMEPSENSLDNYERVSYELSGKDYTLIDSNFKKLSTELTFVKITARSDTRRVTIQEKTGYRSVDNPGRRIELIMPVAGGEIGQVGISYEVLAK